MSSISSTTKPSSDRHTLPIVGLIRPPAGNEVKSEARRLYKDKVQFVAAGLGIPAMDVRGYEIVLERVIPKAVDLAETGVNAISLMGTSISFYRGYEYHEALVEQIQETTGLPASTMGAGILDGLRALEAHRVAVVAAYTEDITAKLVGFLTSAGFQVDSSISLGFTQGADVANLTMAEIAKVCEDAIRRANGEGSTTDALVISCGAFQTLDATPHIEEHLNVPVVASTEAALRSAVRLVGHSGRASGFGQLLEL